MYNGIGLSTARGSGTNGYVTRNLGALRPQKKRWNDSVSNDMKPRAQSMPSKEILAHNAKRAIEVEVMKLRIRLEDEKMDEDKIEERLQELRKTLESGGVPQEMVRIH